MFRRNVKYLVVCYFLLSVVINAVADISLADYIGNDEPLLSTADEGDCDSKQMADLCYQKCGPNYACILGFCFCVPKDIVSKDHVERVILRLPSGNPLTENSGSESSEEDGTTSSEEATIYDEKIAVRPALRHHIAHFCPNLHDARVCIRKCMKVAKPAFCGKDHVCYCGHRYDFPGVDSNLTAADVRNQFRDLYEKYFGPNKKNNNKVVKLKLKG